MDQLGTQEPNPFRECARCWGYFIWSLEQCLDAQITSERSPSMLPLPDPGWHPPLLPFFLYWLRTSIRRLPSSPPPPQPWNTGLCREMLGSETMLLFQSLVISTQAHYMELQRQEIWRPLQVTEGNCTLVAYTHHEHIIYVNAI